MLSKFMKRLFIAVIMEIIKFALLFSAVSKLASERLYVTLYFVSMLPVVLIFGVELGRPQSLPAKLGILTLDVAWNALLIYLVVLLWRGIKAAKRDW